MGRGLHRVAGKRGLEWVGGKFKEPILTAVNQAVVVLLVSLRAVTADE